jgi:hypothetical protein
MRKVVLGRVALVIVLIESLALLHIWMAKEIVLISQPSGDERHIAQIVGKRAFPYITVDAYLIVRDVGSGDVVQKHFINSRDVLLDIVMETHSVNWDGNTIRLDIEDAHYSGEKAFSVQ